MLWSSQTLPPPAVWRLETDLQNCKIRSGRFFGELGLLTDVRPGRFGITGGPISWDKRETPVARHGNSNCLPARCVAVHPTSARFNRNKADPTDLRTRRRRAGHGGLAQTGPLGSRSEAGHRSGRLAATRVQPPLPSRTLNEAS